MTFGGGARDDETFMPEGQENIPRLLQDLIPRGTMFTQVVNRGILGHYVATASLATGVYETFNNFAAVPPDHPTIFEYFRKDRKRPAHDAWVVAPANGFHRIGESGHRLYGHGSGASVVLPKRLLAAGLSAGDRARFNHLLSDNYETPLYAPDLSGSDSEVSAIADVLKMSLSDFAAYARNVNSPDELSVFVARRLMRQIAPTLLWITLHDIDIAHAGTYSLYVEGIQRSDRLCYEIWNMIEADPEYRGKTTLLILPDFCRDADTSPGGNGFQHHRTGDALSRTTWMIAIGPGIRENSIVERPVESIDLTPTIGSLLGVPTRFAQGKPLPEVVA